MTLCVYKIYNSNVVNYVIFFFFFFVHKLYDDLFTLLTDKKSVAQNKTDKKWQSLIEMLNK